MSHPVVHMLWIRGALGRIERLSIASFLSNGYTVKLWTYGDLQHVPVGVAVCDANSVLAEEHVFKNAEGYLAGASDLFRYAVLRRFGGLWSDIDVVALKPADQLPAHRFMVFEPHRDGTQRLNGNVIHYPDPRKNDVMDMIYAYARKFPKDKVKHLEIAGPLLAAMTSIYPDHGIEFMPTSFANPYGWFECPQRLFSSEDIPDSHFMHLYSGMWYRTYKEKYKEMQARAFPPGSVLDQLATRYGASLTVERSEKTISATPLKMTRSAKASSGVKLS